MRARPRARGDALRARKAATCRLTAVWLRQDIRYTGRATWGPAPRRWLADVVGAPPAQQRVCQEDVRAGTAPTARLQRLAPARQEQGASWRLQPVGAALEGLRGVQCTVAVTGAAELGDWRRVETPRQARQELGLLPAEASSGERRRPGAITTAGNAPARRALGDGAWASRSPAKVRRPWPRRLEQRPQPSPDRRGTAQGRRCQRVRRRRARGKHPNHVAVAIARALAGVMWAMAKAGPLLPYTPRPDGP